MKSVVAVAGMLCGLLFSLNGVYGGMVTLNFNTDGQLPHQEAAANYSGSTVGRYLDSRVQDIVAGGLWKEGVNATNKGFVGYYGNIPALATTDTTMPLSINARVRFNRSITQTNMTSGEFYLNMRSAAGTIWMYFKYDSVTGDSYLGGRHSNGSIFTRAFPTGKKLGDFHDVSMTWDPTNGSSFPATLWVDGVSIGSTYAGVNYVPSTAGYVEFGDFMNATDGNSMFEVDWLRFGNDLYVVPEPATMLLLLSGFVGLRLRKN